MNKEEDIAIAFAKVREISSQMIDALAPILETNDVNLSLTSLNTIFTWIICKSMRNFKLDDEAMDVQFDKVLEALRFLYKNFKESSKLNEES